MLNSMRNARKAGFPRARTEICVAGGFSLIELMVSIVIGMIVAAGAVTLIVSIDQANSETIQATRINQELRALASVIADEIKRARHLHDPIANVGQGASSNGAFDFVDTSIAGCLAYGYQDATQSTGTVNPDAVDNYEAIYLSTTSGVGSVMFARDTTESNVHSLSTCGLTSGATRVPLSSAQLNVTALTFTCVTTNGSTLSLTNTKSASCNQINVTLSAKLVSGDSYTNAITRTYVQQVFVRSGAVKTS